MLTDEEVAAIRAGDASISGNRLFNANAKLSFPTGTWESLYFDRKFDVLADRLLGEGIPKPKS